MISALFEDIATRVYSVDLQDITVFTHGEHLTSLGMTFVWVREIPSISKTFQNANFVLGWGEGTQASVGGVPGV
jgi:hypothetical protein